MKLRPLKSGFETKTALEYDNTNVYFCTFAKLMPLVKLSFSRSLYFLSSYQTNKILFFFGGLAQVEEVLGEEPDVKEQLFEVLKQYAAERDVESLAEALPDILVAEEHQQLIDSVR